MDLTERHDLRSGAAPWDDGVPEFGPSDKLPGRPVDVAICGAGIMGAMLADRLSAAGLAVAVLDRRRPGLGSTSASTALVLWEADVPLTHLARKLGEQEAVRRWRRVHLTATRLWKRLEREDLASEYKARPSLYLDGSVLDGEGLRAEAELRARHGLPSVFLQAEATAERFGIAPRFAIVSTDSFEANPLKLALALLDMARKRGTTVSYPADVLRVAHDAGAVVLVSDQGEIRARHVILASGYERPRLFLPATFALKSSYAMATAPGTAPLWRDNAMIWEAANSYLYARVDPDGRVIAGGGDEAFRRRAAARRADPGEIPGHRGQACKTGECADRAARALGSRVWVLARRAAGHRARGQQRRALAGAWFRRKRHHLCGAGSRIADRRADRIARPGPAVFRSVSV